MSGTNEEEWKLSDSWRVPASSRFEVALERQEVSRLKRATAFVDDIVDGLINSGTGSAPFDISGYRYHVIVRDRRTGGVAHEENWKSDSPAAQKALDEIRDDLGRLTIAEFCKVYGIAPS